MSLNLRGGWHTWKERPGRWYKTGAFYWWDGREKREVQITLSPTGRNVQVHVDGKKWGPQ